MIKRKDKRLLKRNTKSLIKKGFYINDNIVINSYDLDFKDSINTPIKDVFKNELDKLKDIDPEYVKFHLNEKELFNNIKRSDIICNWWRYVNKRNNKLKYLTITTPHIRTMYENDIDYEILSIMNKHYHIIYGYEENFNIDYKFYKIKDSQYYQYLPNKKYGQTKDTFDLIKEWIEKNKDSKEYLFYKNLIHRTNEVSSNLKEPILKKSTYELNCYTIIIPLFYEKSYKELFENIDSIKFSNLDLYEEDNVNKELIFNKHSKEFFSQFIPYKEKTNFVKRTKLKLKK